MGAISNINGNLIKLFSFINKDGKVSDINTYYGQKWENIKTDNKSLNSIFKAVDNGDGIVQAEELNVLNKILNYIDNLFKKDEIIDEKEIAEFQKQLDNGTISIEKIKNSSSPPPETSWSEGLDRNITTIQLPKNSQPSMDTITNELKAIGAEQGFTVEEIQSGDNIWIEDYSIRRADGKIYIPYHSDPGQTKIMPEGTFTSARGNENVTGQGSLLENGGAFNVKADKDKIHYGTSYLEGGNVLNTKLKDGTPAAVVGESSIGMTLEIMGLEKTPENIELVKKQIASDLGLELEQVTFIPQHEFHIDMIYRPLQNGKFAVPDYEQGIAELEKLRDQTNETIQLQTEENPQQIKTLKRKLYKLNRKIEKLEQLSEDTKSIREEAYDCLSNGGYEVVKIPCFTTEANDTTNFMNGIGGTSAKTGQTFYITNKSEFPELQAVAEQYLHQAGIDKVYFVSTQHALSSRGGIDCLTQER